MNKVSSWYPYTWAACIWTNAVYACGAAVITGSQFIIFTSVMGLLYISSSSFLIYSLIFSEDESSELIVEKGCRESPFFDTLNIRKYLLCPHSWISLAARRVCLISYNLPQSYVHDNMLHWAHFCKDSHWKSVSSQLTAVKSCLS